MTEPGIQIRLYKTAELRLQITEFYCSFSSILLCNKSITTLKSLKVEGKTKGKFILF